MLAFAANFDGAGGHSSLADTIDAPLYLATKLASAIGDYGVEHRSFGTYPFKGLCTNIGNITGDGSYNVIPTDVRLSFSMRPPPGDSVGDREADIRNIAKELHMDDKLSRIVSLEPFESHNPAAFANIFENAFDVTDLPYWTEAALLSEAGVNAVVFGPGELSEAHTSDEKVSADQLLRAAQVYARAIEGTWN